MDAMPPGVVAPGVAGPCGEPALTCVEKGEEAAMEEVTERVLVRTFEAGRRQSRCG